MKDATERLGGQYSPHLHPQCTHLVVQISFLSAFFNILMVLMSTRLSNTVILSSIIYGYY